MEGLSSLRGRETTLLATTVSSSMQGNDKLEELLRDAVSDKGKLDKLRSELGLKGESNE